MKNNKKVLIVCICILFGILGFFVGKATEKEKPIVVEVPVTVKHGEESEVVKAEVTNEVEFENENLIYKKVEVEATAYCPCEKCCGKSDGITATGTKATAGRTIAVDPKKIPYGSELIIDGKTYIAEDCGGAIKGNRIDVFCSTHEEALKFGRKNLTVEVKQ